MPGNTVLHEDSLLRLTVQKNVAFAVWSGPPTVTQVHALGRAAEKLTSQKAAGVALVSVVSGGVPKFSDGVRDELVRLMKSRENFKLGVAHLVLLDGFAGTTVRAFLGTTILLSRTPAPTRVFGRADDALAWVHERVRGSAERWTPAELESALREAMKVR
jgi:hypothetical protein